MRAHEIMESELSPRNIARLQRATDSFSNGFETEAARKEAMTDLSRIYEDGLREVVQDNLRHLFWTTMDRNTNTPLPGKEAEHAELRKMMDMLPYGLSQIRDKQFPIFDKYGDLPTLKKLVALRQEMKDAPLVPKKRDLEKAAKAAALAANTVIADATRPLKEEALKRTEEEANEFVAAIKKQLDRHKYNPYAIVPKVPDLQYSYANRPSMAEIREHREKQKEADARRRPYLQFVKRDGESYSWFQESADAYVKMCLRATSDHYDSYVAKMNQKIKNPTLASFSWLNDVWGHSVLSVQLADGTKEVWKTQMIINCSKLGKLFNQWPTRRVK